jgi:predicted dehydrogenase
MKCILTGLGGRSLHWLNNLREHAECEVVAYVEPFEANKERAINEHNVPRELVFNTLDEAIAATEADFVLDVTPPAVHQEIANKAFAAGLHVLGEKPLSDNFAVAKEIVEAGQKAGVKHMITQNYRFGDQPRTSRRLIEEGLIGKPGQCDVRFYMPWADIPNSHYVNQPFMLINDMMVHHFDLIRYVIGEDPVSVQAITWNQPWGWHKGDAAHAIVFQFESGLVATHVSVGCAVGSITNWNGDWRVEGPNGSIDWANGETSYSHLHRTETPETRAIPHDSVVPGEQAILDEFVAAIKEDREPECSAADNLKSLAMVFAAIESAKSGQKVALSEL